MTELEPRLFGKNGNLLSLGDVPTKVTYCEWNGKPGEHRGTPVNYFCYDLLPSDKMPVCEINGIFVKDGNDLKKRLVELIEQFPRLLENKSLTLTYSLGHFWSSLNHVPLGEIKYVEVKNN